MGGANFSQEERAGSTDILIGVIDFIASRGGAN